MRTLRRLLSFLIFAPLALILAALAVANRQTVRVVLDPFVPNEPALAVDSPLWLVLFSGLLLGVLIGGVGNWLSQGRQRRKLRRLKSDVRRLERERDELRRRMTGEPAPSPQSFMARMAG